MFCPNVVINNDSDAIEEKMYLAALVLLQMIDMEERMSAIYSIDRK